MLSLYPKCKALPEQSPLSVSMYGKDRLWKVDSVLSKNQSTMGMRVIPAFLRAEKSVLAKKTDVSVSCHDLSEQRLAKLHVKALAKP